MNTLWFILGTAAVIGLLAWLYGRAQAQKGRLEQRSERAEQANEDAREARETHERVSRMSERELNDRLRGDDT
jgi:hypothetical protein